MNKKIQKKVLVIFTIILVMIPTLNSFARDYSPYYSTPNMIAGSWWSGYDNGTVISVSSQFSQIYGGDVGMTLVPSSVGLSNSFARRTDRKVNIELKEDDAGSNTNEIAGKYEGTFSIRNGVYNSYNVNRTYTNASQIEPNSVAELYIRVLVSKSSGDTTGNIASGLFSYRVWTD